MEITPQEQQNRILTINTLTRDYFIIVGIVGASNLVTLTLISFGTSNQLAISAMIITSFLFALVAGGNQMGMIIEFYKDTEEDIFTKKIKNYAMFANFLIFRSQIPVSGPFIVCNRLFNSYFTQYFD